MSEAVKFSLSMGTFGNWVLVLDLKFALFVVAGKILRKGITGIKNIEIDTIVRGIPKLSIYPIGPTDVLIISPFIPREEQSELTELINAPYEEILLKTLKNSLIHGASIFLEIEEGEIDGFIRDNPDSSVEEKRSQIILFDTVPGGSGYLKKKGKIFQRSLKSRKISWSSANVKHLVTSA